MYTKTFIVASLSACWRLALAVPTWPASTDELEDLLYLNTGYRARGFANAVTPCSNGLSPTRVTAAEWLRTAFHDAISGNIYTGEGGLDGSIAWEVNTVENEGVFADDSVIAWAPFVSDLTSLSDVIAAATYAVTRSCSNITLSVRGGRVDATQAGPQGFIPQPQNAIGTFKNQFARMGLDTKGMIQFVACGHTIGGVHRADHPDITNLDVAPFDSTPSTLDNGIAVQYVNNSTSNPLVVGISVANKRNSDFVVFSQGDKNVTIQSLAADPNVFANACQSIFQKMIDFVPAGVILSNPIAPYEVKPYALQLTLLDGGSTIRFTGEIRVRSTQRTVFEVQLSYLDRNGAEGQAPIQTTATGNAAGFDDSFSFFGFSVDLPTDTSISSFTVSVLYGDSLQEYDNNGNGFQVEDTVIYQAPQSCLNSSGKLTVVAAVRGNQTAPNLELLVKTPQASPNVVPSISTTTLAMATQSAVGSYGLYSAALSFSPSMLPPIFGVYVGNFADTRKSVNGLPTSCATLATTDPSMSSSITSDSMTAETTTDAASSLSSTMNVTSASSLASSSVPSSIPSLTSSSVPSSVSSPVPTSATSPASSSSSGGRPNPGTGLTTTSSSSITTSSSTPTPTSGYAFKGCYYDAVNPRALPAQSSANSNMTVDSCAASCAQYQFFGLEYAQECYCGNTLDNTSTPQPVIDCNMPCSGNSTQTCGASYRISLYTNIAYTPPGIAQIPGYGYKGCYTEGTNTRALIGHGFSYGNMTVEYCASLCKGSTYFGVEYGQECYCGATLQSGALPAAASDCSNLCAGNSAELCGGPNRLNLYQNATAPVPPVVNPLIANYTYQGCYTDSVNNRVLKDIWFGDYGMTVEGCATFCKGEMFFGTEYGSECYCGNVLDESSAKVGEGDCGMTCGGNATELCGSSNRLSLYKKTG